MSRIFKTTLLSMILLVTFYSTSAAVIDMMAFEASLFDSNGDKR